MADIYTNHDNYYFVKYSLCRKNPVRRLVRDPSEDKRLNIYINDQ